MGWKLRIGEGCCVAVGSGVLQDLWKWWGERGEEQL
jgi:hypothetical protein